VAAPQPGAEEWEEASQHDGGYKTPLAKASENIAPPALAGGVIGVVSEAHGAG